MTDEQNERAARVWREACGAYEDNSHDLIAIHTRTDYRWRPNRRSHHRSRPR